MFTFIFSIHKSLGILANRDIIERYIDDIRRKISHFGDRFSLSRLHSQEAVFRLNNNSKIGDISSVLSTILQRSIPHNLAGSGIAIANSIASLEKHLGLLEELRERECLRRGWTWRSCEFICLSFTMVSRSSSRPHLTRGQSQPVA